MKENLKTIGLYIVLFPSLFLIIDLVQGKDINWLMYLKFSLGVLIGGGIVIGIMEVVKRLNIKSTIYIFIIVFISFGIILGLLMRFHVLDFLK